jgi:hypothetical protein
MLGGVAMAAVVPMERVRRLNPVQGGFGHGYLNGICGGWDSSAAGATSRTSPSTRLQTIGRDPATSCKIRW